MFKDINLQPKDPYVAANIRQIGAVTSSKLVKLVGVS